MAGLTLSQAEQHLNEWLSADSAVAKGQAYSLGGRTFTRADAREIRENIRYWQQLVKQLSRGGVRTRGAVVPHA
jgi:hypothetical protein